MGVIETPSLDGLEVKLKTKKKVKIEGPDPGTILAELQQNGGLLIDSGQLGDIELEDDGGTFQYKFKKYGALQIEVPSVSLRVTCEDSSGNLGTATAMPDFITDEPEDDDDDDNRDED